MALDELEGEQCRMGLWSCCKDICQGGEVTRRKEMGKAHVWESSVHLTQTLCRPWMHLSEP